MYFVFDVEALGLYGLGFSVGWVVVDDHGKEHDEGYLACPYHEALHSGTDPDDVKWVEENVLPHLPDPNCEALPHLYDRFWEHWMRWKEAGATMVADCVYPVEANFLRACVMNNRDRKWEAPYPLIDLAGVLLAKGYDPIGSFGRTEDELPEHQPVNDARQSARVLIQALEGTLDTPKDS